MSRPCTPSTQEYYDYNSDSDFESYGVEVQTTPYRRSNWRARRSNLSRRSSRVSSRLGGGWSSSSNLSVTSNEHHESDGAKVLMDDASSIVSSMVEDKGEFHYLDTLLGHVEWISHQQCSGHYTLQEMQKTLPVVEDALTLLRELRQQLEESPAKAIMEELDDEKHWEKATETKAKLALMTTNADLDLTEDTILSSEG